MEEGAEVLLGEGVDTLFTHELNQGDKSHHPGLENEYISHALGLAWVSIEKITSIKGFAPITCALSSTLSSNKSSPKRRPSPGRRRHSDAEEKEARQETPSNIRTAILSSKKAVNHVDHHDDDYDASSTLLPTHNNKVIKRSPTAAACIDGCSTAFLASMMCCYADNNDDDDNDNIDPTMLLKYRLPFDPTIQESIECIFAHQLEEGLNLLMFDDSDDDDDYEFDVLKSSTLQHPSGSRLQQLEDTTTMPTLPTSTRRRLLRKTSGSLHHVGTYDPTMDTREPPFSREITKPPNKSPTSLVEDMSRRIQTTPITESTSAESSITPSL